MPEILSSTSELTKGFPKGRFFSENVKRGEFGLANLYKHSTLADSSTLATLTSVIRGYSHITYFPVGTAADTTVDGVAAYDDAGVIYVRQSGSSTWTALYKPRYKVYGILGDGLNFYFVGPEYVGRTNGFPTAADADVTGTISVTNGSANVTGSGTAFNGAAHNGKRIKIGNEWYTVSTVGSGTSITLASNYTGSTASGLSYRIFSEWNDLWQDAGSSKTGYEWFKPIAFEGDVIFPRQDRLARLNGTDGSFSTDSAALLNLPDPFYYRCGAAGANGILFGIEATVGSSSFLILWDNRSLRSIAPWIRLRSRVQAIEAYESGWLVITEQEILYTNGYAVRTLSDGYETKLGNDSFAVDPTGAAVVDKRLVIANRIGGHTKKRSGLYVYDIEGDSYDYVAPLGGHTYDVTPGALFVDVDKAVNVSYQTAEPAKRYLCVLSDEAAPAASVISQPLALTGNSKSLAGVKADLAVSEGGDTISGTISAKVAALNRRLFGLQKAKIAGSSTTAITVDGTALSDVQVGDEVTVMEGANAGLVRHITAITGGGTSTEVWTLSSAITANIEADCHLSVAPFRLVSGKTFSSATELRDVYFNCPNSYEGKRWLVKLVCEGLTVPVEILSLAVIAQEQGPRT